MPAQRRPNRRFYLLAILAYLAVIAVLLSLALFGRGSTERLGDARVTVRYEALPLFGRSVGRAVVSYRGLRLSFGQSTPIVTPDGGTARPRELRAHDEGIDIGFERGLRLELRDAGDGSLSLAVAGDEAPTGTLSLVVPVRVPGGLKTAGNEPMVTWRRDGRSWYLSAPPGSRLDAKTGTITLALGSGSREIRFGPTDGDARALSARWLTDQAALVDETAFRAAVDAFADAAWDGWTRTRLSADRTLWRGADGRFAFSEEAGAALLGESLARGEYPARRALVAGALDRALRTAPGTVSSATASAFVGNLREHARRVRASEAPGVERIRAMLAARDPALFLEPGLVPFLLDHGPFNLVQETVTLAGTLRAGSLAPAVALGVLEAYLDYDTFADAGGTMAAKAREVARTAPASLHSEGRQLAVLLETGEGTVDTVVSIRCGAVLVRAASVLGDDLARGDRTGPRRLGRGARAGGRVPARHPPAAEREPRCRHRGCRPGIRVPVRRARPSPSPRDTPAPGGRAGRLAVDRRGPRRGGGWSDAAQPEALVPRGPAPLPHARRGALVTKLELHGTAWRPAADYAQYSDGWAYDAAEQQVFVKLTGRTDTEEIVITY